MLVFISVIGSIDNLYGQFQVAPAMMVLLLVLIYLVIGIITYYFPGIILKFVQIIKSKWTLLIICLITVGWQLLLIIGLSGNTAWDPSIVTTLAAHRSIDNWYPDYFSYYPNNNFLLLLERGINNIMRLVGINSYPAFIIVLNVISYFLVDVSIFILFFAVKRLFSFRIGIISGVLTWILLAMSPIGVIPYSDILAFFISSLFLLIYSYKLTNHTLISLGALSAIGFLLKPSLIIFDIALIIEKVFQIKKTKQALKPILVVVCAFFVVYFPLNFYTTHNTIVRVDSAKKMPMNHFMAMGMTGAGGFNNVDVVANQKIKNPEKRKEYNNQLITQRLKKFGIAGYTKFLFLKQVNNTSDASFGWGIDAGKEYLMPFNEKISLQSITRKIFLQQNSYVDINWHGLKIINQLIWSSSLLAMLYSIIKGKYNYLILKSTILGSFAFLLLFEGGRSRYLIQFLPYIFTLASIGISGIYAKYYKYLVDASK